MSLTINIFNSIYQQQANKDSIYIQKPQPNIGDEINGVKIDGKIGDFKQGGKGDCVLLAMLLCLKFQDWGQKGFSEAVQSDGQGGAYVTLYDCIYDTWRDRDKDFDSKKVHHITNEEILRAKSYSNWKYSQEDSIKINNLNSAVEDSKITIEEYEKQYIEITKKYISKTYSSGDDDVLAVELAVEKSIKNTIPFLESHLKKIDTLDSEEQQTIVDPLNSYRYRKVRLSHGLILGDKSFFYNTEFYTDSVVSAMEKDKIKKTLTFLENNINHKNITAYVGFSETSVVYFQAVGEKENSYSEQLESNHAYAIKGFETDENGVKFVLFVNPHDSSKEMKLPYYTFLSEAHVVAISAPPEINQEYDEYCKQTENNEAINLDKLVKEENDKLQKACIQKKYDNFVKELIAAPIEEKEKIVKEYFESYRLFTSGYDFFEERTTFINFIKNNLESLITTLDKAEYGWGRGKAKKALIKPLVDNIITALKDLHGNYYDEKGYEYCEKIRDDIMKELDAHFYTNEKNIIVFFNMLLEQYETILNYRKKNS